MSEKLFIYYPSRVDSGSGSGVVGKRRAQRPYNERLAIIVGSLVVPGRVERRRAEQRFW